MKFICYCAVSKYGWIEMVCSTTVHDQHFSTENIHIVLTATTFYLLLFYFSIHISIRAFMRSYLPVTIYSSTAPFCVISKFLRSRSANCI